ncbi:MAG: 50S ribosome-binding GTPase [Planctomycetes bacterium]|nr:50S ribosome-binding GTPase [Planctomycetota bacterium]
MSDTIFALATPTARSHQALLRVSGETVPAIVRQLCDAPMRRASMGFSLKLPVGELPAFAWVLPGPHTLTGEDVIELRVPGNPTIIRQLEERLRELGCRDAEPGEFTRRALECGKLDLHKAEGVLQLINATTDTARRQALSDLSGETATVLAALTERLRTLSARFEMSFDFSEEEHALADEAALKNDLKTFVHDLETVVVTHDAAPRRDRAQIALFGPPNAGKSTLFNALLGKARALVSDLPGTTRDPVEADLQVGDHSARLIDLSGVGASDSDRGRYTEHARERALQADVLLLLDAPGQSELSPEFDVLQRRDGSVRSRALWVFAKSDLGPADPMNPAGLESLSVSGLSGGGLDDLRTRLAQRLDQSATGGATSLLRIRSREACKLLSQALADTPPPEVVASDVRRALKLMDEALLVNAPGEVLDLIFSRFCIGK